MTKVLTHPQQKSTNFYTQDLALQTILKEKLKPEFFEYAHASLTSFGELCAGEIDVRAKHTDRIGEPKLIRYDQYGEEVSEVWVNDGYKKTVEQTYNEGIVGYVHKEIPQLGEKGNYVYSFAQGYLLSQTEPGFYCPVTLSMATAYLLEHYADDSVKARFMQHVCSTGEVQLFEGATFLTERQGGSDVGANIVQAVKEGDHYKLFGEKYFASNAGMCGVAMVLARIEGAPAGSKGLTLFAVPWRRQDNTLNGITIRRLKDKLGVRAVPSGEVVFDGAVAYVVGDPSKGIYYMLEALNLSRICNAMASIGIMKRALSEAINYATSRTAFGQSLADYPMVQETLSNMSAKHFAELHTTFDLIEQYDAVTAGKASDEQEILVRLLIALVKKETAEQAINFSHEAIEMHGGNGYIEDFVTPRLLRDAQVLTVWEGTANILAHELIRLVGKVQANVIFINHLRERLVQLNSNDLIEVISVKVDELEERLRQFSSLNEASQTLEAKPLMKHMARMYESVVVAERAVRDGEQAIKFAEIYVENTWGLRKFGEEMLAVKYFNDVVK